MKISKISSYIIIALFIASSIAVSEPQFAKAAGVVQIGTSPTNVYGYPNLGNIPSGVTADFTFDTEAFMSFRPNPIGVGQTLLVNIWTCPGSYHAFYRSGYTVTIEKPDGTTEKVGPINSYLADATAWFEYIPDQAGTWRLKFDSAGTYIPKATYVDRPGNPSSANYTAPHSVYYKPSSTEWQNLTVQQDLVSAWPSRPMTTDYWTRPANPTNRDWWPVLGNYPFTGGLYYYPEGSRTLYGVAYYRYTAYVQAPNTAHVVWRRQQANAGLMGGIAYQYTASGGSSTPNIIYNGRCYQSITKMAKVLINGTYYDQPTTVWECYDLRTGQVYWDQTGITQVPTLLEYAPPGSSTVPGAEADLGYSVSLMYIGSRLVKYNPYSGAVTLNISISPITSAMYYMPQYCLSVQSLSGGKYALVNWTTAGTSTNFQSRIASNISWPMSSLSTDGCIDFNAGIAYTIGPNSVFETAMNNPSGIEWNIGHIAQAVDLYTGQILWSMNTNDTLTETAGGQNRIADHGKIALGCEGMRINAYDGRTGAKVWSADESAYYPWSNWHAYSGLASYDLNSSKGIIIDTTYAGIFGIDWDNGNILWHFSQSSVPFEGPYGDEPFFTTVSSADGKIYAYSGEHTPSQPLDRGWSIFCINATNGELIWKMLNPMTPGAVADGYLAAANSYDGYLYVFGKGQSATTVSAPQTIESAGTGIVISGSVMDMSPGDQGSLLNPTARFDSTTKPGTVPCVNAASIETQMEYLYVQQPLDGIWHNETITGVPVTLTAIDSTGNVIDIGTATTNGYYGNFGTTWAPPSQGQYTVIASFAGDDSYGSSASACTISVGPAPSTATPTASVTTQPLNAATTSDLLTYIAAAAIAIIIAIALVGVLLYRKH